LKELVVAGVDPNDKEYLLSFQAVLIAFSDLFESTGENLSLSFDIMMALAGRIFLKLKSSFLIGCGWAPLGPNLIPYLMENFLLHFAM
jgi:hypothetical protein